MGHLHRTCSIHTGSYVDLVYRLGLEAAGMVKEVRTMTREDLERIADELEEVINCSVFTPYSDEEEAMRNAMNELRWKAEEMK